MKLVELALQKPNKSWGTYPSLEHKLKNVNPEKIDVNNEGGDTNYYDNIEADPSNHDQVDKKGSDTVSLKMIHLRKIILPINR